MIALALRNWKPLAIAAVIAALSLALIFARGDARHWQKLATQEKVAHALTAANYRTAAEQARANDLAHARIIEATYATIAQEKQNALETQLADARRNLADYVQRMRATTAADQSGGGATDMPGAPDSASEVAAASGNALVPVADLDICAVNTVKAEGWRAWWAEVGATPR